MSCSQIRSAVAATVAHKSDVGSDELQMDFDALQVGCT